MLLKRFFLPLKLINILSLDVVLNGLVLSWMFGLVTGLKYDAFAFYLLGMAIWCIYTLDHLLDAHKNNQRYLSIRHLFHKKYAYALLIALVLVVTTGIFGAVVYLPPIIQMIGLLFVLVSIVYLFYCYFLNSYFIPKEIIITVVYTCGLWMPYLASKAPIFTLHNLFLFSFLFLTVLNNLVLFAAIDVNEDKKSNFDSIFIRYPFLSAKHIHWYIILTMIILFAMNVININVLETSLQFNANDISTQLYSLHNDVININVLETSLQFNANDIPTQSYSLHNNVMYISASFICLIINVTYILILKYSSHPFVKQYFRIIADNLFLLFIFLYFI
jgi:hypothetical protein